MEVIIFDYIKGTKKQDLAEFLVNNCEYVDSKEQKEIEELIKKLENDTDDGREISLDELL